MGSSGNKSVQVRGYLPSAKPAKPKELRSRMGASKDGFPTLDLTELMQLCNELATREYIETRHSLRMQLQSCLFKMSYAIISDCTEYPLTNPSVGFAQDSKSKPY